MFFSLNTYSCPIINNNDLKAFKSEFSEFVKKLHQKKNTEDKEREACRNHQNSPNVSV